MPLELMNLHHVPRFVLILIITVLLFRPPDAPAGRPGPPVRQPPQYRQANMLMLRFQDALAEERWPDALSLCSDRVRAKAADWPSPKSFFTDTMPVEHVLAHSFGCWSCGTNFYGLFVTISAYDATPRIDWHWGIAPAGDKWVVDYPPVKLDEYVAKKKAAIQERDERVKTIRRDLEPKVTAVKTRLTAVSDRLVLGAPMNFRLEMINAGPAPVHYIDPGVRFYGLAMLNEKKEPVPYGDPPSQIMINRGELAAGATVVLADTIDINKYQAIKKPGKYVVQFNSPNLQLGQPIPMPEIGRFGETLNLASLDFIAATNTFPSNAIEIEVRP